jgi:TolB-like protein
MSPRAKLFPSPSPNRTVVLDGAAFALARRSRALSREGLAALSRGPHPVSVATVKRAEGGHPVYLETARRLAELLETPLSSIVASSGSRVSENEARRPGICVLSFGWLGAVPGDAYLAAGLTEDLMTRLARWWFPVVVTPPRLELAEGGEKFRDAAEKLAVRYWVEGSVRREGGQVRVSARLVDSASARVLWTQAYDRALGDVLAFQHEVAARIVHDMGETVVSAEASRLAGRSAQHLNAWEMSLKGAWHFRRLTKEDNQRARGLLQESLRIDRRLPLAWYTLAMTYRIELLNRWAEDFGESIRGLYETGERFADAMPEEAGHHVVRAYVRMLTGDRDGAAEALQKALGVEPNHCMAYSVLGQTLAYRGRGDEALEQFEMALRLRPISPENWQLFTAVALSHFVEERYEASLTWAEKALEMQPRMPVPLATRAVACSYLGDAGAARRAVEDLRRTAPNVSISSLRTLSVAAEPSNAERFFAGLERAGLPE